MQLENQVVSLDLAKRLKELNVKQYSIFVWEYYDDRCYSIKFYPYAAIPTICDKYILYSAFTVSELISLLPVDFPWVNKEGEESAENVFLDIKKYGHSYGISYVDLDDEFFDWELIQDESLPNALAKMLIHLLENNLLKLENENE